MTEEEKAKAAEEKARLDAERRARLAEQVKSTGLLKLLGAKADGDGSIADVLGKGDVDRDQEKAFQGVGGVGVANNNDQLRGIKSGGSGSGRVASVGGLRGGGSIAGGGTGAAATEKKVSGVVKSEAPAVDGELDPAMVAKEVRTRLGAIKACYERALKRNPNLSGKVVIHWTITQAGTVSGVDVESGHARRRRGRELHQVTGCPLALPGAVRRICRGLIPVRLPGLTVVEVKEIEAAGAQIGYGQRHIHNGRVRASRPLTHLPAHAYNLYRCDKYLIFFDLVAGRGGIRVKGLAPW